MTTDNIDHPATDRPAAASLQPRGRSRSEEKRQQIFDTAANLFATNGYTGTSMDQIAEAAGVSKQTVYSHFGDKQGLFIASIRHKCIVNALDADFFQCDLPPREVLLKLAQNFIELLLSEGAVRVHRVCVGGAEQHPEVSQMFYEAGPQPLVELLTNYLQSQADRGELALDNARHAASQFLSMINGDAPFRAVLGLEQQHSAEELDSYNRSCVDMFLRAYRP
ncbi:TetR/AcrR family transcriptional regulator [Exilibacterium tricleocarpae]|uniref:TetR/AcrR family transcriptional regulator n=1 Tax=Exilibacterium tricleocarpae TaxID=2591008 RepID=A0A545U5R3_9GAMM|nr:TetR/AcrR family transcriptional regulator [Exilibacterium tricleocarpae]TQV84809.1 TetR/AcrR family transcriptional regulator [Exilibacterium tricleocarpae]